MGFWDFLSTGKTAEKAMDVVSKTTDGIIAGLDAVWFTNEEKAEMHQKALETHIELMKVLATEDTSKGMTRRYLSFGFCGSFLLLIFFSLITWKFDPEWAEIGVRFLKMLSNLVLAVIIFYFGGYSFGYVMQKKNGK